MSLPSMLKHTITKSAADAFSNPKKRVTGKAQESGTWISYLVTISDRFWELADSPCIVAFDVSRLMIRLIMVRSVSNVIADLLSLHCPVMNWSTNVLLPHPCSPMTLTRTVLTTSLSGLGACELMAGRVVKGTLRMYVCCRKLCDNRMRSSFKWRPENQFRTYSWSPFGVSTGNCHSTGLALPTPSHFPSHGATGIDLPPHRHTAALAGPP